MSAKLRGFSDVDGSMAPHSFVAYLDAVDALPGTKTYRRATRDCLALVRPSKVVDVGCGTGTETAVLASLIGPGGTAVGLDTSRAMIEVARARHESPGLGFILGGAERLPFRDDAFDAARFDRVLHHLPDPTRAIAEGARVTRSGGRVLAIEPDLTSLHFGELDDDVMQLIRAAACRGCMQPALGGRLRELFDPSTFEDVGGHDLELVHDDLATVDVLLGLRPRLRRLSLFGLAPPGRFREWWTRQVSDWREGRFRCVLCLGAAWGTVR